MNVQSKIFLKIIAFIAHSCKVPVSLIDNDCRLTLLFRVCAADISANRRRHSVDMTSLDHVTSHGHRQQPPVVHGPPPPPAPSSSSSSSSHARPARSSSMLSYERELESRLELMRQRALSAEQRAMNERLKRQQLMHRLNNTHSSTDTQLTHTIQQLQHQLTLVTDDNRRLETQLQQQQQNRHERCHVATQTHVQLDTSTLYQLLTNITLHRLHQLELRNNHLLSRDTPPSNQLRRTSSLPASDVTRDDNQLVVAMPGEQSHHQHDSHDSVTQSHMTSDVKSRPVKRHRTSHLDIFKKLHTTSRRSQADVINTYKQPIRVRHDDIQCDVTPTSSFNRLQHRRNGLIDL